MSFKFKDLTEPVRQFMAEEIQLAAQSGNIYYSKRFVQPQDRRWPDLLAQAARSYTEHWLAFQLQTMVFMKGLESVQKPLGGYTVKHVPETACETLADGQFNRFYMAAVCRQAVAQGAKAVYVYRAKQSDAHRSESDALIGQPYDPNYLLDELRNVQSSLGHALLKPNSGLSVTLSSPE